MADDSIIAELNQRYLHRARPTNVIAFPMQEGLYQEINPHTLGDVVISVETAEREAREAGLLLDDLVDRLLIHGILHLVGYDHERNAAEARRTKDKEAEILHALRADHAGRRDTKM